MADLAFECVDARPERYAVGPTLVFHLRVHERSGIAVHGLALRCQFRVEPQRRKYSFAEEERLEDLFGKRERWHETMKPMQLATVSHLLGAFVSCTDTAVSLPCSYDMEVATGKYFHSLDGGEIPLLVLFSGSVFTPAEPARSPNFAVEAVPWHNEVRFALPVTTWREMMDLYFPGSGWLRLRRSTIDAIRALATARAVPDWDDLIEHLVESAHGATTGDAP